MGGHLFLDSYTVKREFKLEGVHIFNHNYFLGLQQYKKIYITGGISG